MQILKNKFGGCAQPAPAQRTIHLHLLLIALLLLSLRALLFFSSAWRTILYPFEWSTMDGYYVFHGLRLLAGEPLYFGYQSLLMPFEYVPLYPAIIGALAKIFGVGVWYERAFSLLCAVAMAAVIVFAVARRSSDYRAAACAGLLFLGPASLTVWYVVRGIDMLAALLALAAVAAAAELKGTLRGLLMVVTLFVLAFFTKQTALFPAAAVVACFLAQRRWRHAAIVASCAAAAAFIISLTLQRLSGGWFFENAFLMTSDNPLYPRLFLTLLFQFCLILFPSLPLALYHAGRNLRTAPMIWPYYFLFTAAATLLAAKAGAALSYFVPAFSAVCILVGLLLGDHHFKMSRPRTYSLVLALVVFQALWFFNENNNTPSEMDYREAAALDGFVKERPGPILTERIDSFALRNGRRLNVEAVQLPILIMHRKYDPDLVIGPVREKKFSLIIYSGIYFGGIPAIRNAIFENYRQIGEVHIGLFFGKIRFLILAPI